MRMYSQPDDIVSVLKLGAMQYIIDDMEEVWADNATSDVSVTPPQLGGSVTWNDSVVTVPTAS